MKRVAIAIMILIWGMFFTAAPGRAEEQKASPEEKNESASVGESIGTTARQVADESKDAYHDIKDSVVKTYKEVLEDFKKAVKEAREAGTQTAEGFRKGYEKEPPPKDPSPGTDVNESTSKKEPSPKE